MQILRVAGHVAVPAGEPNTDREHLRVHDMSVGTSRIPVGGTDDQASHSDDEINVVPAGRATLATDSGEADAGPGSVIYMSDDLSEHAVVAPAESPPS